MAFNGSGTFDRIHNWQEDADNTIGITPDRHDAEDDGFATGLSLCVTRDGQSPATANMPFGGFRLTGVGAGVAATDAATVAQIQSSGSVYATATGSANAYVLTLTPVVTAYAAGQKFTFLANFLSTGAATLNVNSLGAKNIKVEGLYDLPPYAIKNGQVVTVIYDGTSFQPINMGAVTGDIMPWLSSTVKPGWLVLDGTTTIGSAASGATSAAAVNEGLYRYLWDSCTDTDAAVSTGRGASAAADFAANKTLTLPTSKDRSMYGIGSTITQAMARIGAATVVSTGTVGNTGATTLTMSELPSTTLFITSLNGVLGDGTYATGSTVTIDGTTIANPNTSNKRYNISFPGGGGSHLHTGGTYTGNATSVLHPVFGVYLLIKI